MIESLLYSFPSAHETTGSSSLRYRIVLEIHSTVNRRDLPWREHKKTSEPASGLLCRPVQPEGLLNIYPEDR